MNAQGDPPTASHPPPAERSSDRPAPDSQPCPLARTGCREPRAAYCVLRTAYRVLRTAYRVLPTACCILRTFLSRRVVESVLLVAVALVLWRTWYLEGLPFGFYVASGSMAPTLLGPHYQVRCDDCGYGFPVSGESGPVPREIPCPNCSRFIPCDASGLELAPGDGVLIHRGAFQWRTPRRWEVVALRPPDRAGQIHVKRVVGLPGESIQIRHGDLFVNGQLARKTLAQQRAMAILVHDARHAPQLPPTPGPRWQPDAEQSGWSHVQGTFVHGTPPDDMPIDWLTYRHVRHVKIGGRAEAYQSPVLTESSYNSGWLQRPGQLQPTLDLLLSFRAAYQSGGGTLVVRAAHGRDVFEFRVVPATGQVEARRNGNPLAIAAHEAIAPHSQLQIEVSLIDRQFIGAIDGRCVIEVPLDPQSEASQPVSRPFSLGASGVSLKVFDLKVFRDVYYASPVRPGASWGIDHKAILGPEEYFVMGDNSPISEDSRTWATGPGLPAGLLFAKPILVHLPGERVPLGPWDFPVPDPRAIRYIR